MDIKRRSLLKGCCAAAGLSAVPLTAFFNPRAFGAGSEHEVLVYLFLRGGIDGLHLLAPIAGSERVAYESKRSSLAIPVERLRPIDAQWGLHPRAGGVAGDDVGSNPRWLQRLFNEGRLALVHGVGMPTAVNRSHFDSQAFMDLGTPGNKSTATGWIARYVQAATGLPAPLLSSAFGFAAVQPQALQGDSSAFTISNGQEFRVNGYHWAWNDTNPDIAGHGGAHERLFPLWLGSDLEFTTAGRLAAEALEYMRQIDFAGYQPEGQASYPAGNLGTQLSNLAQLIKLDTGIVVATLDFGGWDTHAGQGMPDPGNPNHYDFFGNLVEELARALDAFHTDLSSSSQGNLMQRVSIVGLSEFGRRVRPNQSGGTDHGHGNLALAMGDRVIGGLHGQFPGLDDASLFEGQDLASLIDYRQLLAEALVRRQGFPVNQLGAVFPGLESYQPLGIFES